MSSNSATDPKNGNVEPIDTDDFDYMVPEFSSRMKELGNPDSHLFSDTIKVMMSQRDAIRAMLDTIIDQELSQASMVTLDGLATELTVQIGELEIVGRELNRIVGIVGIAATVTQSVEQRGLRARS